MSTTPSTKQRSVGSWRFRLLGREIDTWPLLKALERHPGMWREITLRQDYAGSAHKDTQCIFLRWPADMTASWADVGTIDYTALARLPEAQDLLDVIEARIPRAAIVRALIAKLPAGGHITPHIDEGDHANVTKRAHLVLVSGYGNVFRCGREYLHMQAGELWRFNHRLEHEVWNGSETDRIHLIVDYK